MKAYESRNYICFECGSVLSYERIKTTFGDRTVLKHGHQGCSFSDKVFYFPSVDLIEMSPELVCP